MGEMISKPDANPILFAILNFFLAGCVGYFMMGQKSKAIAALVYWIVGYILCAGLLSMVIAILTAIDAYQLGQKLQAGESIGEKETAMDLLAKLPGFS